MNYVYSFSMFVNPASLLSTNRLVESAIRANQRQRQNAFKHLDDSKTDKKKQKKQADNDALNSKTVNRSFALYNQSNGRIEGVVKNRLNVGLDDAEESEIIDDDIRPKNKWVRACPDDRSSSRKGSFFRFYGSLNRYAWV